MRDNRKKGVSYLAILILVMALSLSGCGKKAEPIEKESVVTTESAESPVSSELPQETEAPEVTEATKVTQAPQVTEVPKVTAAPQATEEPRKLTIPEAPQPDENGEYDLEALFGPEQEVHEGVIPKYTGHSQIETEYTVLDIEEGVVLTQEEIDRVDFLCKTMEEVTGLSFLNGKYYKGKKITIHVFESLPSCSADDLAKSIDIDDSCIQGDNFLTMIHELVHILQVTSVCTGAFPFYDEGHAEYWSFEIAEYILDNNINGLVEMIDVEAEYDKWVHTIPGVDITQIYEKNIVEWIDQGCYFAFAESWPAYIYGSFFFMYLEDVYGDANAFLPIYARIPYAATGVDWDAGIAGRKYMNMEPLIKMMMVTYGADVFDNFYPWLKEHEELFEPYKILN